MTRKNETGYWIKRKGHEKFSDTKPEQFVQSILDKSGVMWAKAFKFTQDKFTLTADIFVPTGLTVIEVDGDYHRTALQERKTRWRDEAINKHGFRVVHVDSRLCLPRWEEYLTKALRSAIENGQPTTTIFA